MTEEHPNSDAQLQQSIEGFKQRAANPAFLEEALRQEYEGPAKTPVTPPESDKPFTVEELNLGPLVDKSVEPQPDSDILDQIKIIEGDSAIVPVPAIHPQKEPSVSVRDVGQAFIELLPQPIRQLFTKGQNKK